MIKHETMELFLHIWQTVETDYDLMLEYIADTPGVEIDTKTQDVLMNILIGAKQRQAILFDKLYLQLEKQ